jgi:RNA polymerase sigma factor (sigma-70 family)
MKMTHVNSPSSPAGPGPGAGTSGDGSAPTHWSLIARLKDLGTDEDWRRFVDTYGRLIYAVAVRSGLSDAEAQEVVQETLVSVSRKLPEFRCDPRAGSFKSWLLNLAHWRIIDQMRKREKPGRAEGSPSVAAKPPSAGADETERTATIERIPDPRGLELTVIWDAEWEKHLMEAAMERLKSRVDPELLQLFDCHVVRGWPASKVARQIGVSLARVYFAKYKAAKLLKGEIKVLRKDFI